MALEANIEVIDDWFIGEDKTLTFYITTGKSIRVREGAAAGDTTIKVDALKELLPTSTKIRFGGQVVTLSAEADIGDTTVAVSALAGAIPRGSILRKVQDVTGWSFSWRMKATPGTTANTLSKTPAISDADDGIVVVTIEDTDTDALNPTKYYHALWRTNAGAETVLAYGSATLRRAV